MCINLGQALNTLISGATISILATIGDKIYPLDIPEGTSAPVVVYDFVSVPTYTLDGIADYNSVVDIFIITNSYNDGATVGKLILNKFDMFKGTVEGVIIKICKLASIEGSEIGRAHV